MNDPVNDPVDDRRETEEGSFVDEVYEAPAGGGRRRKRRGISGCLPVLVVLAVVAGLLYFGVTRGMDFLEDQFGEAEDYPGPGSGRVTFQVVSGDSVADMGRNLKDAGVVASVDAFTAAASSNPDATSIQAGYFSLQKEMRAADVVDILVDPDNVNKGVERVTFPEGLTVDQIVETLVEKTSFKAKGIRRALGDAEALGLPDYAEGDPEGYLFPATYIVAPGSTPADFLRQMVDRWKQAAEDADLAGAAERLGYSEAELMTIASLTEAEARPKDMAKVARVIYNRLENEGTAGTVGLLQIDATVNFALGRNLGVAITNEDKEVDSPYNTHQVKGLPPGPIEAPGDAAIQAATKPADGDWYYYVTVDLKTGETKFAESYDEFLDYKAEFIEYCTQSDAC
ncbi:MAG: mltG [Nocardioides sp.]|nr:mltG [Nocardioides sp.]